MPVNQNTPFSSASIPVWFKAVVALGVLSWCYLLARALLLPQALYFGLPAGTLVPLLGAMILPAGLFLAVAWRFPNNQVIATLYWVLRYARELVAVLAVLGLFSFVIFLPLFYFKAGGVHLNLRLLFSLRAGALLFNLALALLTALWLEPVEGTNPPGKWLEQPSAWVRQLAQKLNTHAGWWGGLIPALLPILITCAVIYFGYGVKLSDYLPTNWNDATGYWVWVKSFSYHGLNVGYNVANELINPATFNRYGEGSPLYIYLYGGIGKLFGWSPQLPLLINFALFGLATFGFVYFLKLNYTQVIWTTLLLLTFWPVLLYLPISSHETLNQALGILLAAMLALLLKPKTRQPWLKALFLAFVFFAAMVRLSWVILFFPLIFLSVEGGLLRKTALTLLIGGALTYAALTLTRLLVPPSQNAIFASLGSLQSSGLKALLDYFLYQFKYLVWVDKINQNLAIVFELGIVLAWGLFRLGKMLWQRLPLSAVLQSLSLLDVYNSGALLAAGLALYLVEGFRAPSSPRSCW